MTVTLTLFAVFFSSVIIFLLKWAIRRHSIHQTLKRYGIPGPEPDFIAGNLTEWKKDETPNELVSAWIKKYGNVFGFYLGEEIFVTVKDLEVLKNILIKDLNVFSNRPKIYIDSDPFPKTLVGLREKRWKEVRSIVTPSFSSGKLKQMTGIVSKKVDLTVKLVIEKAQKKEPFDIYKTAQGLTLDVIAACAFAMKTTCQENQSDALLSHVRNLFAVQYNKVAMYRLLFPSLTKVLKIIEPLTSYKQSINFITDHLESVVKERRNNPNFKSADMLQLFLENCEDTTTGSRTKMTVDEAVAQAFLVFIGGYETTGTSLGFTFYLLAMHPEIQDRLYEEIQQAKDSDYSTVIESQYLDQVYNEALRLYPPVTFFVTRVCDQDYDIGSHTIPKGANIFVPVWDIHHDPHYWPDPYKFDPDRFSPENKGSIKNMTFLPFGAGPRNCIGARFAQLEAKMIIFKLLKRVKLEVCEKTEDPLPLHCISVVTSPKNGVWVKASLRN